MLLSFGSTNLDNFPPSRFNGLSDLIHSTKNLNDCCHTQWHNNGFRAHGDFCLGAPVVRVWLRGEPPNELHHRGSGGAAAAGSRGRAPCGG